MNEEVEQALDNLERFMIVIVETRGYGQQCLDDIKVIRDRLIELENCLL